VRLDILGYSLGAFLSVHAGSLKANAQPDAFYEFSTAKYTIQMRISFPPPYEGDRLELYQSAHPGKAVCISIQVEASRCTERFFGAVAVVAFSVIRSANGKSAAGSVRELATLVQQSPGLPERPPFAMSIRLIDGLGSDLQAFGYDETPLPQADRAAERKAAKGAWRRCRQELYMDRDPQPFAVVEWLHTTSQIRLLSVDAGSPH
jgi:hypothetical protein